MVLILVAGIVLLYCIRKRLVPQLLFLAIFAAAGFTMIYGFDTNSIGLIITGLLVGLAAVGGFARAYIRPAAVG